MGCSVFRQVWYWAGVFSFALAVGVLLYNHEPWRDEMQAWLLVRDSGSWAELWSNSRYEGHPLLWHLLLWLLSRWSQKPAMMQVAHGLVAVFTAAVFLAYAPFSRLLKLLWVFGYFPLYEYGVISRNYGLTVFFLFLALAVRASPLATALVLGLAANASPMGVLLAPVLAPVLIATGKKNVAPLLLLGLSWGVAAVTCLPPDDYEHARGLFWQWNTLRGYYVLRGLVTAFLPIFPLDLHFWNNPMLFPFPPLRPALALFLTVLVATGVLLWVLPAMTRTRRLLLCYVAGLVILATFFYVKFPGTTRHHGFAAIWTVIFLWLSQEGQAVKRWPASFFAVVAVAHLAAAAVAAWVDLHHPFSTGKAAAQSVASFCREHGVVGHPDWAASTVAGFLPPASMFYATTRKLGSFVVWNLDRAQREDLTDEELVSIAVERHACLLLNRALRKPGPCTLLVEFPPAVVIDEQFRLYRCWPQQP